MCISEDIHNVCECHFLVCKNFYINLCFYSVEQPILDALTLTRYLMIVVKTRNATSGLVESSYTSCFAATRLSLE